MPLTQGSRFIRYAAIAAVMIAAVGAVAYVAGAFSPARLTQSAMMIRLQAVGGVHPGFRSNHAKGICFSGVFDSSGEAAAVSKAEVFRVGRVAVVGRFALAGGMPFQTDALATVRSMALQFQVPGGQEWRTGMNNIPVFVASTVQGFADQLVASKPDAATGKPDPAVMAAFLVQHPETARALALIKSQAPSRSFADSTFNSLDTFLMVNAAGARVPVRWAAVALPSGVDDTASAAVGAGKNALFDDLIAQVHRHPLKWQLTITVGAAGDPSNDATMAWPPGRRRIDAGILTVRSVTSEDGGACTDVNFDPLVLPPGIEASDDPLLSARSSVYARSFTVRASESASKPPSSVTDAEIQMGQP